MIKKASRILELTENACVFIASVLIIFSAFSVCLEITARIFLNTSFVWVNEINEYVLLYVPFLVAAWLLRHKEHISIDIIDNIISDKLKKILDIFIALIGGFVSFILIWYGTAITYGYYIDNIRSLTTIKFPQVYVVFIIPFGSFLLLLEFIRMFAQSISTIKNG